MPSFTHVSEGMAATPDNFNSRFSDLVTSASSMSGPVVIATFSTTEGHALYSASSTVTHGATHLVPTDVYAYIGKSSSASGGGVFGGVIETAGATGVVLAGAAGQPHSAQGANHAANRSLAEVQVLVHDGAGAYSDTTTNGNVFGVVTRLSTSSIQNVWMVNAAGLVWQAGGIVLSAPAVPASGTASGSTGQISWDASYVYVCASANSWRRASLSAF